jgi:hypothetical protein
VRRISRREFGTIAAVALASARSARQLDAAESLRVGVTTSSFRDLPRVTGLNNVDDIVRALRTVRAAHVELALANLEPAPPSVAPFMGGTPAYPRWIVLTPEEIAATNARARADLRRWRLETGPAFFESVRDRFEGAGIAVHACAIAYDDSFTDEEIDATFRQVTCLGVKTLASPVTRATAVRIVPFAERHGVSVAVHNQIDGASSRAIGVTALGDLLRLSPVFTVKLDVANVTASDGDPIAALRQHRSRLSHVVISDRLRHNGVSQPFGEGDTPIPQVLRLLAGSAVPAFVEYDYIGLRSPVEEVAACLRFVEQARTEFQSK